MTPIEVYQSVERYGGAFSTTVCDIKAKCAQFSACAQKSSSCVLDFDGAAQTYRKEKKLQKTPPSVDAIAVDKDQSLLILIEKKTWSHFFSKPQKGASADLTSEAIAKVATYDLQGKYSSTREICEYISKVSDLFISLPHVFVFLTELSDLDSDPTGGFATMLGDLAISSSIIDYEIQSKVAGAMKNHLKTVSCKRNRYLSCNQLDAFIDDPGKFD